MKSIFTFAIATLSLTQFCFAQWVSQSSGTVNDLNDISFADAQIESVVGNQGTILRTTNGGKDWIEQSSGTHLSLFGISLINADIGIAVGADGIILKTTNGGTNWIVQSSGVTDYLYDVSFIDENTGMAVGQNGTILKTTDGGLNWNIPNNSILDQLNGISLIDENNALAVCSLGPIFKTTDGGQKWSYQPAYDLYSLYSVCFVDTNNAFAVGQFFHGYYGGVFMSTTDGGQNWLLQSPTNDGLRGVSFITPYTGIAVGGTILKTSDGGLNWTTQISGTTNLLTSVAFIDSDYATAVGREGTILRTTNGGAVFIKEERSDEMPAKYFLSNNYPNPFNPSTKIRYSIPHSSLVQIRIYDILGYELETLVNENKPAGTYELTWNAANLPSGVYFYQIKAGDFIQTRKMILLK